MNDASHPVRFGANPTIPLGLIIAVFPNGTIRCFPPDGGMLEGPIGTVFWTHPSTHARIVEILRDAGKAITIQ